MGNKNFRIWVKFLLQLYPHKSKIDTHKDFEGLHCGDPRGFETWGHGNDSAVHRVSLAMRVLQQRVDSIHPCFSISFICFDSLKLDRNQITYGLPTADVRGTILGEQCPVQVDFPCQPRKYRAYNGYCNNVQNPRWGNANTRYLRFLPAEYSDGKGLRMLIFCFLSSSLSFYFNSFLFFFAS
jgi:hypothetical protein